MTFFAARTYRIKAVHSICAGGFDARIHIGRRGRQARAANGGRHRGRLRRLPLRPGRCRRGGDDEPRAYGLRRTLFRDVYGRRCRAARIFRARCAIAAFARPEGRRNRRASSRAEAESGGRTERSDRLAHGSGPFVRGIRRAGPAAFRAVRTAGKKTAARPISYVENGARRRLSSEAAAKFGLAQDRAGMARAEASAFRNEYIASRERAALAVDRPLHVQ